MFLEKKKTTHLSVLDELYIYIIRVLIYCIYIYICILCIHKLGNTCYNDSQVLLTLLVTLFGPKTGTFFLHVKLAATNWANPGSVTVLYFFAINWSDLLSKISNYMAKINISKIWVLYFFAININWLSHLVGVFWLAPRILKISKWIQCQSYYFGDGCCFSPVRRSVPKLRQGRWKFTSMFGLPMFAMAMERRWNNLLIYEWMSMPILILK